MNSALRCISTRCRRQYLILSGANRCECGCLLAVDHSRTIAKINPWALVDLLNRRWGEKNLPDSSGVWRYRELVLPGFPLEKIVSRIEGNTRLYDFPTLTKLADVRELKFKHEGENPTGSFKDRGMTAAISWAKMLGARAVICASTGNTAASAASYAAAAGLPAYILIPDGGVALGKVVKSLAYGARVIKARGSFDSCMKLVDRHASALGLYVVNSVNPIRLEGQKTIIWEICQQLNWRLPDWIIVPGGNLGNTAAFGTAIRELQELGILDGLSQPRLAVIQASGANPFYRSYLYDFKTRFVPSEESVKTIASAIAIGVPVNHDKAVVSLRRTNGVVCEVSDEEILLAKARLDREGVGAEPASAATLAGLLKLRAEETIKRRESVVCVLTGHFLNDQDTTLNFHAQSASSLANKPVIINPTLEELKKVF